jgi:hypothetical protein
MTILRIILIPINIPALQDSIKLKAFHKQRVKGAVWGMELSAQQAGGEATRPRQN